MSLTGIMGIRGKEVANLLASKCGSHFFNGHWFGNSKDSVRMTLERAAEVLECNFRNQTNRS